MRKEIERKFLVKGNFGSLIDSSVKIIQGYLSTDPERSVRVRTHGSKGFLTIKGQVDITGTTRTEWEKEIPLNDAKQLLNLCKPYLIEKTRHFIKEESGLVFEVDQYAGMNEGLVMAELELPSIEYAFIKPGWLGIEVTGQAHYYNASLTERPYSSWK